MGLNDALPAGSVYLDANIFIYALEGFPDFLEELSELFEAIDRGSRRAVTSELSLAECLVKPLKDSNLLRQAAYETAICNAPGLSVVPVDRKVLLAAARLRAEERAAKLPDAIHMASAVISSCTSFLTNDRRLHPGPGEPRLVLLSDVVDPS